MIQQNKQHDPEETTHFGFKTVARQEKQGLVGTVFDSVARKYDIMNDVMSGGLHRLWKDDLIRTLHPQPGMTLLDVAGGTGDIALRFLKTAQRLKASGDKPAHVPAKVTVCDINPNMLEVGRDRAIDRGLQQNIDWITGNAESLPFPDHSYDAYSIAFGIRNVTNIDEALNEALRVLRPGGRFLCLEFSTVNLPLMTGLYDAYSFRLVPEIGKMITGDRESYQYLVESIRQFPPQDRFKTMIEAAGFTHVTYRNMTGGVVALHSGWKI